MCYAYMCTCVLLLLLFQGLLHLREDAEDLAGLRRVGLLEGRLRIEEVLRLLLLLSISLLLVLLLGVVVVVVAVVVVVVVVVVAVS